jgi:AhpD family alkylhydroperoxidase
MTNRLDYNQIAPNGVKALGGVYGYVMQSGLPAELVDLVYLRVSQINNCAYCLDMHTRDLIKKGGEDREGRIGAGLGGRRQCPSRRNSATARRRTISVSAEAPRQTA